MNIVFTQAERKELILSAYKRGFRGGIALIVVLEVILLPILWIL